MLSATVCPRTRDNLLIVGTLCLNGAMRLLSTRHPVISDRESRSQRRKRRVETLRELPVSVGHLGLAGYERELLQ